MSMHYSDPEHAGLGAVPGVETFHVGPTDWQGQCPQCEDLPSNAAPAYGSADMVEAHKAEHVGWYWWPCFPGCMPDGEAMGPFDTEDEALADAREGMEG